MTPEQIDLVRKSFDALWPFRRKLAEQFYGRFFELAPETRRLFPSDMEKQQLKLMDTIAAIVGTLDQREICWSVISHTGRKHAALGAQTSHYVAFGEALIWGLQQQFGPAFTPEMQQAWIVLYDTIQAEMIRAAKTSSGPPSGTSIGPPGRVAALGLRGASKKMDFELEQTRGSDHDPCDEGGEARE